MSDKAHIKWKYLTNPFLTQTADSYKNFLDLSTDHLDSLRHSKKKDNWFNVMEERYTPVHLSFTTAYQHWKLTKAQLGSSSKEIQAIEQDLSQTAGKWDVRIQTVFYQDTKEYQFLLPENRKPFQKGSREQRLAAIQNLCQKLEKYPLLTDVHKDVNNFYLSFAALREQQNKTLTAVDLASEALKAAHQNAADIMYRNLGLLINLFGTDYQITAYYKLNLIRKATVKTNKDVENDLSV